MCVWVASCPPWAQPAASASPGYAQPLSCSPWGLPQGGNSPVPSQGPSISLTALGNLGGPWVLGRARRSVWMGWVTSGRPWSLSGCRSPTHSFINFPKVLPLSGQFSQRPRHLWARLCAACWMASRHGPSLSRDVPSVTASSLLHSASVP